MGAETILIVDCPIIIASGVLLPIERVHAEDCPGCVADRLTPEDKAYLREKGWADPTHVYAPLPELAPLRARFTDEQALALTILVVVLFFVWLAMFGVIPILWTIGNVVVALAIVGLWYHHADKHRFVTPRCPWCTRFLRREERRRWDEYQQLLREENTELAAQKRQKARQLNAADYQRLLKERRGRGA